MQVENEFGNAGYGDFPRDVKYLKHVSEKLQQGGIVELLVTSDSPASNGDMGSLPGGRPPAPCSATCVRSPWT